MATAVENLPRNEMDEFGEPITLTKSSWAWERDRVMVNEAELAPEPTE